MTAPPSGESTRKIVTAARWNELKREHTARTARAARRAAWREDDPAAAGEASPIDDEQG